ncbi:MAG: hypothetical protein AAGA65_22350 [Actinomycetota bacterium]
MSSRTSIRALTGGLLAFGLVAAGCSGGDSDSEADRQAFCTEAEAFLLDDSVTRASNFSETFFADVDQRLGALEDTAPDDVLADVVDLRAGFAQSDTIFAEFDYDLTDPSLVPALERIDQASMLAATENIEAYLVSDCGLVTPDPDAGPGPIDEAAVADIMTAFGINRDLAECIYRDLGDVANIDSAELTPELLTTPVCGTTLLGLLNGTG